MRSIPVCLVLLLAMADVQASRAADVPPDTIAVLTDASRPVLALDPATGDQHVAYVSSGTLHHAWQSGGGWLSEPIASPVSYFQTSTQYGGFDLRIAPGGQVFAIYRKFDGQLELAQRVGGVWQPEVLDAVPGQVVPVSLAVSPVTGEPSAAWTKAGAPGFPVEVKLARRSGGAWATQVIDTVSLPNGRRTVAVAVDHADRPRVAWGRPRADDDARQVLTFASAIAPGGPFVAAAVDSQLSNHIALAVDPSDGEPRIVFEAVGASTNRIVRYAARDEGALWQTVDVTGFTSPMFPSSFALDPSGHPFIAIVRHTPIEPAELRGGDEPEFTSCVYFQTASIHLYRREGATGTGAFVFFGPLARPDQEDVASGPRALASRQTGVVDVAWRYPAITCSPYAVSITRRSPFADVPSGAASGLALAPVVPNPARLGGPLRVTFRLEQAASVALELRDVAGRQIAESSLGEMAPGPHQLDWSPAAPRAGVYWLTVRAGGARLGSRSAVLVR